MKLGNQWLLEMEYLRRSASVPDYKKTSNTTITSKIQTEFKEGNWHGKDTCLE